MSMVSSAFMKKMDKKLRRVKLSKSLYLILRKHISLIFLLTDRVFSPSTKKASSGDGAKMKTIHLVCQIISSWREFLNQLRSMPLIH